MKVDILNIEQNEILHKDNVVSIQHCKAIRKPRRPDSYMIFYKDGCGHDYPTSKYRLLQVLGD